MNAETFFDLSDVREKLQRWREDYNQVRPHSSLGDRAPEEFARSWQQEWSEDSAPTAGPAKQVPAGAVQCADSSLEEPEQLFVPPSDVKGGREKLPTDSTGPAAEKSNLLETVN